MQILYTGYEFEKKALEPYWISYFNDVEKLNNAKKKLLDNLSIIDQEEVQRIIDRIELLLFAEHFDEDIFTQSEKEQIRKLENEFWPRIKRIDNYNAETVWEWDKYKLLSGHFEVSVFYYQCGMHQLQHLDRIRNLDIIDAGAYIGDSSVVLSYYTNKTVYAFEALRENYNKINKNSILNKRDNIIPVNLALGKESGEKVFYIRSTGETGHGMVKREGLDYNKEIHVNAATLDEWVEEKNINVGCIKVDIEGAEQEFLMGAERTIRRQKPALLISIYHMADDFFVIKEKIQAMNVGYKFSIFRPISRGNILLETMLICETNSDEI